MNTPQHSHLQRDHYETNLIEMRIVLFPNYPITKPFRTLSRIISSRKILYRG